MNTRSEKERITSEQERITAEVTRDQDEVKYLIAHLCVGVACVVRSLKLEQYSSYESTIL